MEGYSQGVDGVTTVDGVREWVAGYSQGVGDYSGWGVGVGGRVVTLMLCGRSGSLMASFTTGSSWGMVKMAHALLCVSM